MDTKKLTKIDVIRPCQGVVDHGLKGLQIPVPLTLELCSGQPPLLGTHTSLDRLRGRYDASTPLKRLHLVAPS